MTDPNATLMVRIYWECAVQYNMVWPEDWLERIEMGFEITNLDWGGETCHPDYLPMYSHNTAMALKLDEHDDCGYEVLDILHGWGLKHLCESPACDVYLDGWEEFRAKLREHPQMAETMPCGDCRQPVAWFEEQGHWFHLGTGTACFLGGPNPLIPTFANLGDLEHPFVEAVSSTDGLRSLMFAGDAAPGETPIEIVARAILAIKTERAA